MTQRQLERRHLTRCGECRRGHFCSAWTVLSMMDGGPRREASYGSTRLGHSPVTSPQVAAHCLTYTFWGCQLTIHLQPTLVVIATYLTWLILT